MQYVSTRGDGVRAGLSEAIARGIAPDGGLYVPEALPRLDPEPSRTPQAWRRSPQCCLRHSPRATRWKPALPEILREAFNFAAPVVHVSDDGAPSSVLELFHGPTAAFKDFGARFLAAALERIRSPRPATAHDSGGNLGRHGWRGGSGVSSSARGSTSSCCIRADSSRRGRSSNSPAGAATCARCRCRARSTIASAMVKEAFVDAELGRELLLSSANSINVGRLLPQMALLRQREPGTPAARRARAELHHSVRQPRQRRACLWAREVGLPVGDVVLATNANLTVTEFLRTGAWQPRPSVATLASAMDVGNPSNMERLRWLFPGAAQMRGQVSAFAVSDDDIRATIRRDFAEYGQAWCPHTATAAHVYRQLPAARRAERWVLVATAHPAKFNDIVEPLIGSEVPVPPALAKLLTLPSLQTMVEPRLDDLRNVLARSPA